MRSLDYKKVDKLYHGNRFPTKPQQTPDIEQMLVQCWADVVDGGPTLNQHWFNVSCLLGPDPCRNQDLFAL